jgi:hypothetical protein
MYSQALNSNNALKANEPQTKRSRPALGRQTAAAFVASDTASGISPGASCTHVCAPTCEHMHVIQACVASSVTDPLCLPSSSSSSSSSSSRDTQNTVQHSTLTLPQYTHTTYTCRHDWCTSCAVKHPPEYHNRPSSVHWLLCPDSPPPRMPLKAAANTWQPYAAATPYTIQPHCCTTTMSIRVPFKPCHPSTRTHKCCRSQPNLLPYHGSTTAQHATAVPTGQGGGCPVLKHKSSMTQCYKSGFLLA